VRVQDNEWVEGEEEKEGLRMRSGGKEGTIESKEKRSTALKK
jgi:hypothetical protein